MSNWSRKATAKNKKMKILFIGEKSENTFRVISQNAYVEA